jgi:endonuclease YncB( thermonuclease family)
MGGLPAKGSTGSFPNPRRRRRLVLVAAIATVLIAPSCTERTPTGSATFSASPSPDDFVLEIPNATLSPTVPPDVPPEAREARVVRYVDGDSLWLQGGTLPPTAVSEVRLLEIDAPEAGTAYSADASSFVRQELPLGSTVYLLADVEDKDRFGRYLRYLWKPNGEFFNEKLVRHGWARAILIPPNDRFIDVIRRAEAEAKAAGRGIWAPASAAAPFTTRPQARIATDRPGHDPTARVGFGVRSLLSGLLHPTAAAGSRLRRHRAPLHSSPARPPPVRRHGRATRGAGWSRLRKLQLARSGSRRKLLPKEGAAHVRRGAREC